VSEETPPHFWRDEEGGLHHDHSHVTDVSDEEHRERIAAMIDKHGWYCHHVLATVEDDDPDAPTFSYTTGLRDTFGHPDLLVSDIPSDKAYDVLFTVVGLLRNGARFGDGDESDDVLEGYPVRFAALSDDARLAQMTWTDWFYDREPFEALEVVYPDARGRWPGEGG
jgi:Domain of unknown function (DUF4262)